MIKSTYSLSKNYLNTALRQIKRNKFNSFVSILSITLGIVISVLLVQYYLFESNYDNYHDFSESIFRINSETFNSNGDLNRRQAVNFIGLPSAMREEMGGVLSTVYLIGPYLSNMRLGDEIYQEGNLYFAENASVFDIFTIELVVGNKNDLDNPGSMMISESLSAIYFSDTNGLGKSVEFIGPSGDWEVYEIVGVYKDFPSNSHITPRAFLHGGNLVQKQLDAGFFGSIPYDNLIWRLYNSFVYIKTEKNTNLDQLQLQLDKIADKYRKPFDIGAGFLTRFSLQPITDIHTTQNIASEPSATINRQNLNFILVIGILVLVLGWINYINLTTANSLNRAKEIGVRKCLGSSRKQLIIQFIIESVVLNIISIVISVFIILSILPVFHNVLETNIFSYFTFFLDKWALYFGSLIFGALAASFYPALMLTRFKPILVLKGRFKHSSEGNFIRKGLVATQFVISMFLLFGIFSIHRQYQYLKNLETGIDMNRTYYFDPPNLIQGSVLEKFDRFKQALESSPYISRVTNSSSVPGWSALPGFNGIIVGNEESSESVNVRLIRVHKDYFSHYGVQLERGRFISNERLSDENKVILNQEAVSVLGYETIDDVLGSRVFRTIGDTVEVVGIVNNFAQRSAHYSQLPIMFQLQSESGFVSGLGPTSLKMSSSNVSQTLEFIEATYKQHFPGEYFSGVFLEDEYQRLYNQDERFELIYTSFTFVSLFISILGLIGLSLLLIKQRMKEISVRKVLGSSKSQIILLMLKEYLQLVIIASIIAIPASFFWVNGWLDEYPMKITLKTIYFLEPLVLMIIISGISVIYQTLRAANANPILNLRME